MISSSAQARDRLGHRANSPWSRPPSPPDDMPPNREPFTNQIIDGLGNPPDDSVRAAATAAVAPHTVPPQITTSAESSHAGRGDAGTAMPAAANAVPVAVTEATAAATAAAADTAVRRAIVCNESMRQQTAKATMDF